MTAPAGVSSGPAPEPGAQAYPDPQAVGTQTAELALGATGPALGATVPPPATEPVLEAAEPTIAAAEPTRAAAEPAGGPGGENASDGPDAGPSRPARNKTARPAGRGACACSPWPPP